MEKILITFGASRNIVRQARLCPVETGGILAGTIHPLTILDAGEPGSKAIHAATRFTSDPDADAACLQSSRQQYGEKVTLLGWWHKHPAGSIKPSIPDCRQATLLAEEFNDGHPLLIGIVNQCRRGLRHKTTLFLYTTGPNGTLTEHAWKLTATRNSELQTALKQAATKPGTSDMRFWQDPDFQFYLNPVGRARIRGDLATCRDLGWDVSTTRGVKDRTLVLTLSDSFSTLKLILPPEYPLNPPIVTTAEGRIMRHLTVLTHWNSLHSLADLAREAFARLRCTSCPVRHPLGPESQRCLDNQQAGEPGDD